jgi:TolB protein
MASGRSANLLICRVLLALVFFVTPASAGVEVAGAPSSGRIAFAACVAGNWDLYTVAEDGSDLRRLTVHPADDLDPAFSPDGTRLAFASRRDGHWNLYLLDLTSGELTPLTDHPHYDGAPAWSPDGAQIAFESFRAGDLDVWTVDLDAAAPVNLTPDSPFGDAGPAWSPDGRTIAFTSWRYGDPDIFLLDLETQTLSQFTDSPDAEERPAFSPDGAQLTFVAEPGYTREVYLAGVAAAPAEESLQTRLTWLSRDDAFAWRPDGTRFAAVWRRPDGDRLLVHRLNAAGELPQALVGPAMLGERVSWSGSSPAWGEPVAALGAPQLPFEEPLVSDGWPLEAVPLADVEVGLPRLSDAVDGSFEALRRHVRLEAGRDFLGGLSEALRPLGFYSDASAYASWHKAGRAFDTLLDLSDGRYAVLELAREDLSGHTAWRVYLRAARQDGSQGRPLTVSPWDHTYEGREVRGRGEGGAPEALPAAYYVDFTALAALHGWQRIPAHDDPEFHWHDSFKAMEYWHFQKTDDLDWTRAMQELWDAETVAEWFSWAMMRERGEMDPWLIAAKGVAIPSTEGPLLRLRE